ncbi:MAG: NrfD/PsrC family molybdoenzyme membrane anchor subunit [Micromonosporaceae bacterium]
MAISNVDGKELSFRGPGPAPPDAREAALRPFRRPGRWYWLLLAALTAVVALGAVAWSVQLRRGLGVSGFNDNAFWAIDLADVVTFIGVSYGGAVISAVLRLTGATWRAPLSRLAEGTAVVTVLIGGALIIPHLGRPDRILELVTRPNLSSPIFWDFAAIGTYAIGSIIFFILPLFPDMAILHRAHRERIGWRARLYAAVSRGWAGTPRQRGVLRGALGLTAIMIIPLAVSVHSVLSWAFALVSRPWWHESIWAPYFVVAALYSGVALVILVVAGFRRAYHLERFITQRHFVRLGFILAAFAAAYLYFTFADILPDAYVGESGTSAVFQALLLGHFALYFWVFVVAAGLLPLLLVAIPRTRTVTGMVAASAFIVPAMWLKRMIMVTGPATYNRMTDTFGTYHFTWVSVSIALAALAAIPLLLMLLFRVVPLLSIDEIEEIQEIEQPAPVGTEPAPVPAPVSGPPAGAQELGNGHEPSLMPAEAASTGGRRMRRWTLRRTGAIGLLVLAAGGLSLVVAKPSLAASRPAATTPQPSMPASDGSMPASGSSVKPAVIKVTGTDSTRGLHLAATVTDVHGMPIAGAAVGFSELTKEFGPAGHLVPLGSAVTDRNGVARLTDQPAVTGLQRYVAAYSGGPKAGPASASAGVLVTTARSPYRPPPAKPFAGLGKTLVGVLLAGLALILLTLAVQVERVRRVCRAGG